MKIGWKRILPWLILAWIPVQAAELRGRVVDRGTLEATGKAKGIAGVRVSVYDGKRLLVSATTNAKGTYRFKRVTCQSCRVT